MGALVTALKLLNLSNFSLRYFLYGIILVLTASCGLDDEASIPETIDLEVIPDSKGIMFVSQPISQDSNLAELWLYDTQQGKASNILTGLEIDSYPVYAGDKVLIIERGSSGAKLRVFDPGSRSVGDSMALPNVADGDPWGAAFLGGSSYALFNRTAGNLTVAEISDGVVATQVIYSADVGLPYFHPVAIWQSSGDDFYVLSQGREFKSYGNSYIMKFSWIDGKLNFEGDKLEVSASLASNFLNVVDSRALLVGLCPTIDSECKQGAYAIDFSASLATGLSVPGGVNFYDSFISHSGFLVFGSFLEQASGSHKVGKFDLSLGSKTDIYTYSNTSDRLYFKSYFLSSDTLILGDEDAGQGKIIMVSGDGSSLRSYDFDQRPYRATVIP